MINKKEDILQKWFLTEFGSNFYKRMPITLIYKAMDEFANQFRKIKTSTGEEILFDDDDYEFLREKTLFITRKDSYPQVHYCYKNDEKKGHYEPVAKKLLNAVGKKNIRYKDKNFLNLKKENLEIVTHQKSIFKKKIQKNNTSGYKGVSWNKNAKAYSASIKANGKPIHLGYFRNVDSAAFAYNEAAKKYFGEDYAFLNKIQKSNLSDVKIKTQNIKDNE